MSEPLRFYRSHDAPPELRVLWSLLVHVVLVAVARARNRVKEDVC